MKDERNKLQTFIANGWTEGMKILHKWGEQMSKNSSHPSKNNKNKSELNGSGGGREKGIRDLRSFDPVGDTNRDQRPPFYPG